MPFDVTQASQILKTRYNAIIDSATKGEIDAELPFTLENQALKIQMILNATTITPYEVHAWIVDKSTTPEQMSLQEQDKSLLERPEVLAFLEQIKSDLGIR